MKFEAWDFGLLGIFFSALAVLADKMEIVLFCICLGEA